MKRNLIAFVVVVIIASSSIAAKVSAQPLNFYKNNANGSQTLLGHTPPDIASSTLLYHAYSNETLNLQIELPLLNQSQLTTLLQNLYNQKSPNYHQWLTPSQFAQQFGYSGSEVDLINVKNYLQSEGLYVGSLSPNGLVLNVSGAVPNVERAFGLHINHYQRNDGILFFGPDANPTIPVQLAGTILAIGGLDNLPKFKPHFQQMQEQALPKAVGTGPGGYLAPNDVKTAYNLKTIPSSGLGQTVGLFELDGYTASDIAKYDAQFGITFTGTMTNILVDGFYGVPNYNPNTGGADEVTLDIELLTAFTSGSNILVYEAPNTTQSWIDEWTKIANDNKAKVISRSWGEPEKDSPTLNFDNTIFTQMAAQGQAVFVAAGDNGAYDAGGKTLAVDEPSDQTYATGVGISKLTFGANQSYGSESASVYGGGGVSAYWSIPSYQAPMASQAVKAAMVSTTMRNVPDTALTADSSTAYSFYVSDPECKSTNYWCGFYGSSIAAPIWASFFSLVNQGLGAPLGFANTWLYQVAQTSNYATGFHQITTGNNGYYPAEPGYNDATGLGSFNGINLYNILVGTTKPTTPPATPTGLTATGGNNQVSLSWSYSTGAASYTVERSTSSSFPSGSTQTFSNILNTAYTDSSVTNATTYYYAVAAVNAAGSSGFSSAVSITPALPKPAAPSGLTAVAGNSEVTLTWNASANAASYTITRATNSGLTSNVQTFGGISKTTYIDTTVTNGTPYYYAVSATNASGTSANSAVVSATAQILAPPTNLTGTPTTYGSWWNQHPAILLQWTASSSTSVVGYNVYRSIGSATPVFLGFVPGRQATGAYDTGVRHGNTYKYYLTAITSNNIQSGPSNQISVSF